MMKKSLALLVLVAPLLAGCGDLWWQPVLLGLASTDVLPRVDMKGLVNLKPTSEPPPSER